MGFSEKPEWQPRMRNSLRLTLRRLCAEARGAEIAEAAAVLPLMFMMLLGIFWFGQAFSIYGAITRAAQEGARAGAAPYCATCSGNLLSTYAANAVSATQVALIASKLDPALVRSPLPPPPSLLSCSNGTAVQLPRQWYKHLRASSGSILSRQYNRARSLRHFRILPIPVPVLAAVYLV